MTTKIKYTDEPLDKPKIIPDFLPDPADLVFHKHANSRVNISTEEQRDFLAGDEKAPKMMLSPRDPSLDSHAVWQSKDGQDRHPLALPLVPIYIQERIHPQAIVESVRAEARKKTAFHHIRNHESHPRASLARICVS